MMLMLVSTILTVNGGNLMAFDFYRCHTSVHADGSLHGEAES